ncbi:ABC transporter ATP-binding protein [Paenibacillus popilliae]|uniref:ATPase component n=1 Tax=Paenibacillus popilliae ATCC 14706 TaxID=1212764 RepID=M9LEX4_PAEPP|nr:ABC transporter ATP-binding protein [Paenibacillus popilliae]GAC40675.1 ATPase component [Paenibacillus popilliae ATCC 14706]
MNHVLLDVHSLVVEMNNKCLLDHVSFQVQAGSICALMGHNGAGKSTTLQSIMGLIKKKGGSISINHYTLEHDVFQYKQQFSYIPEEPMLLVEFTVFQYFQFYASLYGINETDFKSRVEYYTSLFDLTEKRNEYPENLSKGMRQKVNIIGALIVETPLIIIDEPFIGLDVKASTFLEQELKRKVDQGATIVLTSHVVERINRLCDQYIVLEKGKIIEQGDIDQFETYIGK